MIPATHPDDEPTPTIRDLYERKDGSAEAVEFNKKMEPTIFRLTMKGYSILGGIMRRNAAAALARGSTAQEAVDALVQAKREQTDGPKSARSKAPWAGD